MIIARIPHGIANQGSTWIMLPMATPSNIGPSKESIKAIIKELSRTPRSVVNLLVKSPVGVKSKKLVGPLKKKSIIPS